MFGTTLIMALAVAHGTPTRPIHGFMRRDSLSTIEVQNNRSVPVVVYLERGDFDTRAGTVGPLQTASLHVETWMLHDGGVRLFVHPEGESDLESQLIDLPRRERLGLLVPQTDNGFQPHEAPRMAADLPPGDAMATTITVENQRSTPVMLYVERNDLDVRLGRIPAGTVATLKVPAWLVDGDLAILVHTERGGDLESQILTVRPHEHLGLRVPVK